MTHLDPGGEEWRMREEMMHPRIREVLVPEPPRRWRQRCRTCGFAVRGATRNTVLVVMAGHTRAVKHLASAPYPVVRGDFHGN